MPPLPFQSRRLAPPHGPPPATTATARRPQIPTGLCRSGRPSSAPLGPERVRRRRLHWPHHLCITSRRAGCAGTRRVSRGEAPSTGLCRSGVGRGAQLRGFGIPSTSGTGTSLGTHDLRSSRLLHDSSVGCGAWPVPCRPRR
jgi:hypothetical protein